MRSILLGATLYSTTVSALSHFGTSQDVKMSREADSDWPKMIFTSHHKSGTVFGAEMMRCLETKSGRTYTECSMGLNEEDKRLYEKGHWSGTYEDGCNRIVHLIRHPYDIIRSSYLYHRQTPAVEPWLNEPWWTKGEDGFGRINMDPRLATIKPKANESYNHYLNRLPLWEGVRAEMFGVSNTTMEEMEKSYLATKDDPRVLTLCLDEVFEDFETAIDQIYGHLIMKRREENMARCVLRQNPNKNSFGHHSTTGTAEDELGNIMKEVEALDDKYTGGEIRNMAVAQKCKQLSKESFHRSTRHLASSPDYFAWTEAMA